MPLAIFCNGCFLHEKRVNQMKRNIQRQRQRQHMSMSMSTNNKTIKLHFTKYQAHNQSIYENLTLYLAHKYLNKPIYNPNAVLQWHILYDRALSVYAPIEHPIYRSQQKNLLRQKPIITNWRITSLFSCPTIFHVGFSIANANQKQPKKHKF